MAMLSFLVSGLALWLSLLAGAVLAGPQHRGDGIAPEGGRGG